jgi:hypothetical protein
MKQPEVGALLCLLGLFAIPPLAFIMSPTWAVVIGMAVIVVGAILFARGPR